MISTISAKFKDLFMTVRRRSLVLSNGLWNAFHLNNSMLLAKLQGKKILIFHLDASPQFMHLESVMRTLKDRPAFRKIAFFVLTRSAEIHSLREKLDAIGITTVSVRSDLSSRFILFCDLFLTVNQGMIFPYLGCKIRACSFHGQPSKGNTYRIFNYRQINTLFFYGPLMRDYYLRNKKENPLWPEVAYYETGQPLSDRLINDRNDRLSALRCLGLDSSLFTVVYAPSFEYCSSMATAGSEIINTLLGMGINVIVKPHPVFYNTMRFRSKFNQNIPNKSTWRDLIIAYRSNPRCFFPEHDTLDPSLALAAADVMLTDYSGIAFDGMILDLGMIYWDCPKLYSEYLPGEYGIDGEQAKQDLACNVGRNAGIVVHNSEELTKAVETYRANRDHLSRERHHIRESLLFNPGRASETMVDNIEKLLGV